MPPHLSKPHGEMGITARFMGKEMETWPHLCAHSGSDDKTGRLVWFPPEEIKLPLDQGGVVRRGRKVASRWVMRDRTWALPMIL